VREKLAEEQRIEVVKEESTLLYGAYCSSCDKDFNHPMDFMMKHYYCKFCHAQTEYMGLIVE
tara:strand:- start:533 stop:718 length:186 start_codon:yes stop_codon:yes gene_type:complete